MVNVQGKKVVIVGMGRTASALARLLLREGAEPFVTERDDTARLVPFRAELDAINVPYECGGHSGSALHNASLVIPSPGVPLDCPPVVQARQRGLDVAGEMEFAFPYCRSRIVAVTGTNGKTTTTELLRSLIEACGHSAALAGNNDTPFSSAVQGSETPEFLVLEVSSYQLETSRTFRPWAGVLLNVTPDHLARHGTMENYAAVKVRLFANQDTGDIAVLNQDDPWARAMHVPEAAQLWRFSLKERSSIWLDGDAIRVGNQLVATTADTLLPGRHNVENVLAALAVMRAGNFDWEKTLNGLRRFRGVEHRIEFTATISGIDFYNDSKSTNIDSLKVALESFERPVVLIAGGRGKGADYRVLRDLMRRHVKTMITIGEDATLLEEAFGDLVEAERAHDMEKAVQRAAASAEAGDVVLLSPACASFDMFDNFEHRGRVFKECVRAWASRQDCPQHGEPTS